MKKKHFAKCQNRLGLRSKKCAFHDGKFCNVSLSIGNDDDDDDDEAIKSLSENNSFHAEFNSSIDRFNLIK